MEGEGARQGVVVGTEEDLDGPPPPPSCHVVLRMPLRSTTTSSSFFWYHSSNDIGVAVRENGAMIVEDRTDGQKRARAVLRSTCGEVEGEGGRSVVDGEAVACGCCTTHW